MKTEGTLIYHKITAATGLLQNNAYGHELVLFCLIIPCVHCLFMFYFYKKRKAWVALQQSFQHFWQKRGQNFETATGKQNLCNQLQGRTRGRLLLNTPNVN